MTSIILAPCNEVLKPFITEETKIESYYFEADSQAKAWNKTKYQSLVPLTENLLWWEEHLHYLRCPWVKV